jgi:rhamnogalacturonyl hydrolase YesR
MNKKVVLAGEIFLSLFLLNAPTLLRSQTLPNSPDILSVMTLVNDRWIEDHPNPGNNGWARSAYFTGNMAMYEVNASSKYLDYAIKWAEQNNWAPGDRPRNADDHCCGQTYIDLYKIHPDMSRIEQIKQRIDDMVDSEKKDEWTG